MILYIVEPVVDAANEQASWEGHMSALKRFFEKSITKSESKLITKVDKVYERVIEAEARDATQEREMKLAGDKDKIALQNMMESVKKQIQEVATRQKEQEQKQDQQRQAQEE